MSDIPQPIRVSTTQARERLTAIILSVQDPRRYCVLTRHGRPVAAIVSMEELKRIWQVQDVEDIAKGAKRPLSFRFGRAGHATNSEAAAAIQKVQLDRRMEREVLAQAGMESVPGGELVAELEVAEVTPEVRRDRRLRAILGRWAGRRVGRVVE